MELGYNKNINIEGFDSLENLALKLSKSLTHGNIALSGGSTYLNLLKIWGDMELDLKDIEFFPVDERVVDFNDINSNWGNTYRNFLSKFNIEPKNHYIDSEKYNEKLKNIKMNTIYLGVGDDGHTASLFSCVDVFKDKDTNAISTISPKEPKERVSLTGEYLINADEIIIIFLGEGKKEIVDKVIKGEELPITTLLKRVKKGIIYIHNPLLGDFNE